jgi:hypothetical protein
MNNYFCYKLFDNQGEDINANSFVGYSNIKVELFKENMQLKEQYDIKSVEDAIDTKFLESEDDVKKNENYFGPQKSKTFFNFLAANKTCNKDRNFKPY